MGFEEILKNVEDDKEYAVLRIGTKEYEGSLSIQNTYGETLKNNYKRIEEDEDLAYLFPLQNSKPATTYKLKDMVEHEMFSNMKEKEFRVYGKDKDNNQYNEEIDGRNLCNRLDELLENNVSMTIVDKNSQAYRNEVDGLSQESNTVYLSDLDDLTKAKFNIDNSYKTDPLKSRENVYEHHKD